MLKNGCIYIPAEGDSLLFIKQYLPRAQEESSVANIVKIESVKEISGPVADFCGHMPEVVGFELDVLSVNA